MHLLLTTPGKSLNKAYRKETVLGSQMEGFKAALNRLTEHINTAESEENAKNHLRDFLHAIGYKGEHLVATKGRADMVIHRDNKAKNPG